MSEKKADTDELDSGWDAGDEDPAPTTKVVGSTDLLKQAGMSRKPSGQMDAPTPFLEALSASSTPPPPRPDLRATVPPPVPASEYVATMMGQAPESETRESSGRQPAVPTLADRHRAILQTLHEEDPLRFDFDDSIEVSVESEAPSIECAEEISDLDPELMRETSFPPKPASGGPGPTSDIRLLEFDDLDDLPVDEVLLSVARQPARPAYPTQRSQDASEPLTISDMPVDPMPPPLRMPNIPSFGLSESDEGVHDRDTNPGFDPNDPIDRVHDRFVVGDYSGALVLAEAVLEENPQHVDAHKYADSCRDMLRQMYLSRLGTGKHVPRMAMPPEQLRWLTLDHRAGFLVSCIDGSSCIDEILDVSGMPPLDALRILYELVQEGVIGIEEPHPPASR